MSMNFLLFLLQIHTFSFSFFYIEVSFGGGSMAEVLGNIPIGSLWRTWTRRNCPEEAERDAAVFPSPGIYGSRR